MFVRKKNVKLSITYAAKKSFPVVILAKASMGKCNACRV
jgi:hypothetical protein